MLAVGTQVALLKAESARGRDYQDLGFVQRRFCCKVARVFTRVGRWGFGGHPGGCCGEKGGMKDAKRIRKSGIMSTFTALRILSDAQRSVGCRTPGREADATKTIQFRLVGCGEIRKNIIEEAQMYSELAIQENADTSQKHCTTVEPRHRRTETNSYFWQRFDLNKPRKT